MNIDAYPEIDRPKNGWRLALVKSCAIVLLGLASLYSVSSHGMEGDSELLPEDQAFAFHAELLPEQAVLVRWEIADGYYMYRDKISFEAVGDNTFSAPVSLPPGERKSDPLFGDVDVYTGVFSMTLPLADPGLPFTLLAAGQGCNEPVGVCYPPIQHEILFDPDAGNGTTITAVSPALPDDSLALGTGLSRTVTSLFDTSDGQMQAAANRIPDPAGVLEPGASGLVNQRADAVDADQADDGKAEVDSVEALRALLSSGFEQPDFLPVEDAFSLEIDQSEANALDARFNIADGYYLYREKIQISASGVARVSEIALPTGVVKEDEYLGRAMVFKNSFDAPIQLARGGPEGGALTLQATYQGCADEGICYPPVTRTFTLDLPALVSTANADSGDSADAATIVDSADLGAATSATTTAASERSLAGLLLGAFVAGLLLTFTPCVLPMIPILSSIIAGQGERLTRVRGGLLALVYVVGTAVTYAAMGAMAGATGDQLQAYFQNIWAIGILAAVFVVMALSMFGLFELQMPAAIQSRLQAGTSGMRGSIPLVFILGLVSALIVGACVSPVLISFLGIAIARADPVLGAQMMSVMAVGMGLPLIALGIGAGHLIPRAGPWMNTVRNLFGVMLIAVAIYLLGLLPEVPVLLLWGVFFIVTSTYLGAIRLDAAARSGWQLFGKGLGTVLLVWGVAALIGGFAGQRSLLSPLPAQLFQGASTVPVESTEAHLFTRVQDPAELDAQFAKAAASGKRVVIDFYADWCVDCVRMEESTFVDPQVVGLLNSNFVPIQIDLTDPNAEGPRAIKQRLGVFGPPAVLFFDQQGKPLADRNFYGYRSPREFLGLIDG